MSEAQRVIKENLKLKEKQDEARHQERQQEAQMLQQLQHIQEQKEQQRAAEWAAREQRISNAMNRMADTVVKRKDLADKLLEDRIRQYEIQKLSKEY
jgi:hypothetical protein